MLPFSWLKLTVKLPPASPPALTAAVLGAPAPVSMTVATMAATARTAALTVSASFLPLPAGALPSLEKEPMMLYTMAESRLAAPMRERYMASSPP